MARARLGLRLAMAYMTACAVIFFVFRYELISYFVAGGLRPGQAAEIIEAGGKLMICAA